MQSVYFLYLYLICTVDDSDVGDIVILLTLIW